MLQRDNLPPTAKARMRRRISQEALAKKSGLSHLTIWRLENWESNPSLTSLIFICDVLGISITEYTTGRKPIRAPQSREYDSAAVMRRWRENAGMDVPTLSERTGVSPSMIWAYESGQRSPTLKKLVALSAAFGISIDEYVGFLPMKAKRS